MSGEYEQAFREAATDPERFWEAAAEKVHWYRKFDSVISSEKPPFYRWFEGGRGQFPGGEYTHPPDIRHLIQPVRVRIDNDGECDDLWFYKHHRRM